MNTCPYRTRCMFDRSTWPQTGSSELDVGRGMVRAFRIELAPPQPWGPCTSPTGDRPTNQWPVDSAA